jgi:chromosome segregation ATPase
MSEGTITPEIRIKQLQEELDTQTDRLLKLFAAHESQVEDLRTAKAEIEVLEKEIIEREITNETNEALLSEKEVRIRELELRAVRGGKQVEHLEPALAKMEEKYSREKDRLGKVFNIAEELDGDLRLAVTELKARDDWYVAHMSLFEDLNKAIKDRYTMSERAVETERQSEHMSRAFNERVDEMVEVRASEMSQAEAEAEAVAEETSPIEVIEEADAEAAEATDEESDN